MKIIIKKAIAWCLATSFFVGYIGLVLSVDTSAITSEEKVYCNATIDDNFAPDSVIVVMSNEISLACNTYSQFDFSEVEIKSVRHITTAYEAEVKEAVDSIAMAARTGIEPIIAENIDFDSFNQVLCIELLESGKQNVLDAIKELEKRNDVVYAGPDYYWTLYSNENDTSYSDFQIQDACNIIDLSYALELVDNFELSTIKVGVIDSGIDGEHSELSSNIDKTGQGLSKDYANSNDANDPLSDSHGHGTKVAGIIKGVCNNVELVSLRVHNVANNVIKSSYVYDAINYAKLNNINILNLSIGWDGNSISGFDETDYNKALDAVIRTYNGLIVCAAGNAGQNIDAGTLNYDIYPQQLEYSNLLVVGASDMYDSKRNDSNFGMTSVDIFAPGTNISTTVTGGGTGTGNQTSMATPFVTGTAALLLSINNTLSESVLKSIILDSAETCSTLDSYCEDGRRLNVKNAIVAGMPYFDHSSHDISYTKTDTTHTFHCYDCNYHTSAELHEFYIESVSSSGTVVGCRDCDYSINCDDQPCYISNGSTGHWVDCSCACYSFFEEHTLRRFMSTNLYTHDIECTFCGYESTESHTWVSYGMGYRCTLCGETSDVIPGIMSLPAPELEAYLASLSDEELEEFIASLPEDQMDRVTALLPSNDEHLTE